MFEKEAEEYLGNFADCANCKERWSGCADSLDEYCLVNDCCYATPKEQDIYIAGAEFGYNKANEWHYVKDGDLPKDKKNFKSYVVAYYGAIGSIANGKPCWEELCYDTENKRWVDKETLDDIPYVNQEGIVIAWKEIVLPKECEECTH